MRRRPKIPAKNLKARVLKTDGESKKQKRGSHACLSKWIISEIFNPYLAVKQVFSSSYDKYYYIKSTVTIFCVSKCIKVGFLVLRLNLFSTWRRHVCHRSCWKKRYTFLLLKTRKAWTMPMVCKAFSKEEKTQVILVRLGNYFQILAEVDEDMLILLSFVFQNIYFFSVKKWVYQHKPAFWQLKFLTGKCELKNVSDISLLILPQSVFNVNRNSDSHRRFMAKHVCHLYDLIRSNSETNLQRNWKEVEDRVKTQLPLRVMSCVQLASKLTSHYKARKWYLMYKQQQMFT